ncbi:hypothetical protein SLS62_009638 [Diatrype stigma]|uniref:Aflatoxin regulatory protein domain-containing protein n=1 Tax=Diatrype stigma TaxID=117547 RepID=A0AAN9UEX3_9PEZI
MPQAPLMIPYSAPASEFDYFSPCESPESMVFQSPTALSSPIETYFRNAAMPPDFAAIPSMAATQSYHTQDRSPHFLATRMLGPVEWSLGLDCYSRPSSASSHVCLSQVSAILGRLKQRRGMMGPNAPPAGQQQQSNKTDGALLQETITMNRESTEQITRVLNCGCLSKDGTLTRYIIAAMFEIITNYASMARGIIGDHVRAEGQVRARVGMILGELPSTSHLLDLLASRWYQAHYHASDPMMTAQGMLSKQEESPHPLSPLAFGQIESKLRQRLQAVTHEIMRYCGRA